MPRRRGSGVSNWRTPTAPAVAGGGVVNDLGSRLVRRAFGAACEAVPAKRDGQRCCAFPRALVGSLASLSLEGGSDSSARARRRRAGSRNAVRNRPDGCGPRRVGIPLGDLHLPARPLRPAGPSARRPRLALLTECDRPSCPVGPQGVTKTGGAQSHGRSQAKDVAVPPRHATQPPGAAARGPRRVPELRRTEAAAPRLQPLRLLRRTRGRAGRRCAEGRCSRLTPGRGVASLLP